MLGSIKGKVLVSCENSLLIEDSCGVGRFVEVTLKTSRIDILSNIFLYIETIVREDAIVYFGFETFFELTWFRSLLKVSGVGAKSALSIISDLGPGKIIFGIENERVDFFKAVSGIGEKTAMRIINDLKKEPAKNAKTLLSVCGVNENFLSDTQEVDDVKRSVKSTAKSLENDAILALEGLGFSKNQATQVVKGIIKDEPTIDLPSLIQGALKII